MLFRALPHFIIGTVRKSFLLTRQIRFDTFKRCLHTQRIAPFTMKLDSPEFHSMFTPELNVLIDMFKKHGYEMRIAGGAVRDLLLGKIPHDIDLATVATPDDMKKLFDEEGIRMLNTRGEKHGTVTCRINDKENYEVTTLRIDVVTDGRHAEVKFTEDWQEDARRRDLTINSLFLGFDGTVYDYFNGVNDLKDRKVRFVGDAQSRIQEDYLRILRYFRFYGRTSPHPNQHEKETLDAIRENKGGLADISGERLFVELKKIVLGNYTAELLETMLNLGIGPYIGLPEKYNLEELYKVTKSSKPLDPNAMTILSALLETEEQAYAMNDRLKMSRDELRTALFIVAHRHDNFTQDQFHFCQNLLCDVVGKEPKVHDRIAELLKYLGHSETLAKFSAWRLPKFPVSGHSLLQRGVPKGPMLAKTLSELRARWRESNFEYTEEDLLELTDEIKEKLMS